MSKRKYNREAVLSSLKYVATDGGNKEVDLEELFKDFNLTEEEKKLYLSDDKDLNPLEKFKKETFLEKLMRQIYHKVKGDK